MPSMSHSSHPLEKGLTKLYWISNVCLKQSEVSKLAHINTIYHKIQRTQMKPTKQDKNKTTYHMLFMVSNRIMKMVHTRENFLAERYIEHV